MSEIMNIIDERKTKKKKKNKQKNKNKTKTEKNKEDKSYCEKVRAKWFCCALKLGFLHLIKLVCKASLIFKSNLESDLSIILKEGALYKSNILPQSVDV